MSVRGDRSRGQVNLSARQTGAPVALAETYSAHSGILQPTIAGCRCNDRGAPGHEGGMDPGASGRQERFRRLYAAEVDALLGFALRRADRAEDAADVVAETFRVAWRRFDDVPSQPQARLWLYGVARRGPGQPAPGRGPAYGAGRSAPPGGWPPCCPTSPTPSSSVT